MKPLTHMNQVQKGNVEDPNAWNAVVAMAHCLFEPLPASEALTFVVAIPGVQPESACCFARPSLKPQSAGCRTVVFIVEVGVNKVSEGRAAEHAAKHNYN